MKINIFYYLDQYIQKQLNIMLHTNVIEYRRISKDFQNILQPKSVLYCLQIDCHQEY